MSAIDKLVSEVSTHLAVINKFYKPGVETRDINE